MKTGLARPPGVAGNHRPELPRARFRRSGAIPGAESVPWQPEGRIHPVHAEHACPGAGRGAASAGQAEQRRYRRSWRTQADRPAERPAHRARERRRAHDAAPRRRRCCARINETVQAADLPGLTADLRQTSGRAARHRAGRADAEAAGQCRDCAADRLATAAAKLPALIASRCRRRRSAPVTARPTSSRGSFRCCATCRRRRRTCARLTRPLRRYPAQVFGAPPPRSSGARRDEARAWLLAGLRRSAAVRCCRRRPYVQRRDWPLDVHRPIPAAGADAGRVLLVRASGRGRDWRCAGCNGCSATAACTWTSTSSGRCRRRRRSRTICGNGWRMPGCSGRWWRRAAD